MGDERAQCYNHPMRALIYGLCHPVTGELRYVGKTVSSLMKRVQQHMRESERTNTHKSCWIRSIGAPDAFVIEEVSGDGLSEEVYWIEVMRALGCDLVNHTRGGEGRTGDKHSPEVRAKIAAAHTGKRRSAEQRARMSEANKGRPVSELTRQKMRDALRSRQATRFFNLLARSASWHLSH